MFVEVLRDKNYVVDNLSSLTYISVAMTAIRRLIGTQIQRDHALRTTW